MIIRIVRNVAIVIISRFLIFTNYNSLFLVSLLIQVLKAAF